MSIKKVSLRDKVENALGDQHTAAMFSQTTKNYKHQSIPASHPDDIWSADLMDTASLHPEKNKATRFLLIIVDVYSRFVRAIPLKEKSAAAVADALSSLKAAPKYLHVDEGTEFYNAQVKKWADDHDVNMYSTAIGAVHAERFIRTLRNYIARFRQYTHDQEWLPALPVILERYNTRPHSTTGEAPAEVYEGEVLLMGDSKKQTPKERLKEAKEKVLAVGTPVLISMESDKFDKSTAYLWSREYFLIAHIKDVPGEPVGYYLMDNEGDSIKGLFYREELRPLSQVPEVFDVNVLKKGIDPKTGKPGVQVEWVGYREKLKGRKQKETRTEWISKNQLV